MPSDTEFRHIRKRKSILGKISRMNRTELPRTNVDNFLILRKYITHHLKGLTTTVELPQNSIIIESFNKHIISTFQNVHQMYLVDRNISRGNSLSTTVRPVIYAKPPETLISESVRIIKNSELDKLIQEYIRLIDSFGKVMEIYLSTNNDVLIVWTIIDAPPFEDRERFPIYEVQATILRKYLASPENNRSLGFRIINVNEFNQKSDMSFVLPSNAINIFRR